MRMHHLSGTDEKGRIYAMTYEEARSYIEYTDTMGSVLGLDSIKELLRRLGDPQDAVPVIHIAGTNGKGSICAFLDEILESAGYSVGRYISSHTVSCTLKYLVQKCAYRTFAICSCYMYNRDCVLRIAQPSQQLLYTVKPQNASHGVRIFYITSCLFISHGIYPSLLICA